MGKMMIFDVDGTLLDTERIYMRAWQEAAAGFGHTLPLEALLQTRAISTAQAEAIYRKYCGEQFELKTIYPQRVRIAEEIIEKTAAEELLMPFVHPTIDWLKERGYTIAVASSTNEAKTRSHLAHAGLLDRIDVVVGGDMVEHGKPAPDIFLLAAQLAGAQTEECLVVGDSPADVGSAKAADIPMVLIPDQVPLNDYMKENSRWVLDSLEELPHVVEEWEAARLAKA